MASGGDSAKPPPMVTAEPNVSSSTVPLESIALADTRKKLAASPESQSAPTTRYVTHSCGTPSGNEIVQVNEESPSKAPFGATAVAVPHVDDCNAEAKA